MTERNHHQVVDTLAFEARRAVYTHADPTSRIEALQPIIAWAVADPYWLARPFHRVQGQGTYYLLWTDVESGVSLVAMALGPGDRTPIHDHLTWGVVGVYQGDQRETRFAPGAGLQETACHLRPAGSVTHLLPPDDDKHFVQSESAGTTISIFFMGTNLGCTRRHLYDAADGEPEEIVSGYANAPCPGQTRSPFVVSQFM